MQQVGLSVESEAADDPSLSIVSGDHFCLALDLPQELTGAVEVLYITTMFTFVDFVQAALVLVQLSLDDAVVERAGKVLAGLIPHLFAPHVTHNNNCNKYISWPAASNTGKR